MPARRVYCLGCGQTYVSSSSGDCTLCRRTGTLVEPDSPEALRDLSARKQGELAIGPRTWGEFFSSLFETAFLLHRLVIGMAVAVAIIVLGLATVDVENPSLFVDCMVLLIVACLAKIIVCGYLFWKGWRAILAENAAERERFET